MSNEVQMVEKALEEFQATWGEKIQELDTKMQGLVRGNLEGYTSMPGATESRSMAAKLRQHEHFGLFQNGGAPSVKIPLGDMSIKSTLTSVQGSGESPPVGFDVQAQRVDAIFNDPRRPLRILTTLPAIPAVSNRVEYTRLDGYTNAADYQTTEGGDKPMGEVPLELAEAPIATIAHLLPVSRQVLDDVPMLEMSLRSLFSFGVAAKAELEIMQGAGGQGAITGMDTLATPHISSFAAPADKIGDAIAGLETAGWSPDLVLLHPNDWFLIQSERAADGDGQYVAGPGWGRPARASIWGLDAVASAAVPVGSAFVMDRNQVAILDRMQPRVDIFEQHSDFIAKNLVLLRAELRLGLAVMSPLAVRKVSLTETASD